MSIEKARLLSLIEFAQQAARMNSKAVARVEQHGLFKLYEHELFDLPGIKLNLTPTEGEDELWMSIARLQETRPPDIKAALLQPWVEVVNNPATEPKLRAAVMGASLIELGHRRSSEKVLAIDPQQLIALEEYGEAESVRMTFKSYTSGPWKVWADEEKRRRKTIRLYGQIFTLQQQLQEGVVEAPLEIAWGVGMGIWTTSSTSVNYPLLSRLCELV